MKRLDILSSICLLLSILLKEIFHRNWVFIGLNYNLFFLALFFCFEYLNEKD